ncbi:hypothetical protein RCL1_000869 [Eukaryota sp. TZLM3-RCL]
MDSIFLREQINVPPELPAILLDWTTSVIKNQPKNLYQFSANYFASLANQSLGEDKFEVAPLTVESDDVSKVAPLFKQADVSKVLTLTKLQVISACRSLSIPPCICNSIFDVLCPSTDTVSWPAFFGLLASFASDSPSSAIQLLASSLSNTFEKSCPLPVYVLAVMAIVERDDSLKKYTDAILSLTSLENWKETKLSGQQFLSLEAISSIL